METISVSNCYNIGEISQVKNYGGIMGYNKATTTTFSNCYYADTCNNWTTTGIQSIELEKLKTYSKILGESYTDDVSNINNGYPILKCQVEE